MPDLKDPSPVVVPETRWLTVDEAALYLRVSPGTIRKLIHDQKLKVAREFSGYRIDRADIDRHMENCKKFAPPYRKGTHPKVAKRWEKFRAEKRKAQKAAR